MKTSLSIGAAVIAAACIACLGGQSGSSKKESERAGDQSRGVPMKVKETDWKKAAAHRAAPAIPPDDLARMEKQSAPGGNLARDAGR